MIERAYRTKRIYKDKDKKCSRTIVLRLTNFKDKSIALKNVNKLKGSDVYINEDFNREETKLRKKLWEEVKQLRSEGKFGNLFYEDKDLKTLFTLVNQEPQKINEWFEAKKTLC